MCLTAQTDLAPNQLLAIVKTLETELGREPAKRWGPRLIDIDLLFYGNQIVETEKLTIPHPRLAERAFVLYPLADIAPNFVHPVLCKTILALRRAVDGEGIRPYSPAFTLELEE
jgi:2-amino-4-hydroxy-6-hydroxymethyldihydropteridine diphosphokinase